MWYANYLNLLWYVSYIAGIFYVLLLFIKDWVIGDYFIMAASQYVFFKMEFMGQIKNVFPFFFIYLRLYFPILQLQEWMWTFIIWLVGLCVLYFYSIDSVFSSNHSFVFHFSTFVFPSFVKAFVTYGPNKPKNCYSPLPTPTTKKKNRNMRIKKI